MWTFLGALATVLGCETSLRRHLSLSPLTFPHRLARVLLLEQVSRSGQSVDGRYGIGMFPLILSVLNRDGSTPCCNPSSKIRAARLLNLYTGRHATHRRKVGFTAQRRKSSLKHHIYIYIYIIVTSDVPSDFVIPPAA